MKVKVSSVTGLWSYAMTFLPADIESLGRSNGIHRLREFRSVADLLRVMLAWAQPGSSFQTAAAWAGSSGIATISAEALFYRLRQSERFLEAVMASMLVNWRSLRTSRRLLLVDATVLTGPGSNGTDWRLHMLYDPRRAVPCGVDLTDAGGAETFARHDLHPGDLVLADRGYGHFRGFICALAKGADVLVRIEPGQMKIFHLNGERTHLNLLAEDVPVTGATDFEVVWHGPDKDCRRLRLIGVRTSENKVCWLGTNLDANELPSADAAELYGTRWQIELMFKRMKTLLNLDELRSREGPTTKAFVYAKLITAFLALRLNDASEDFSPYGYPVHAASQVPKPLERIQFRYPEHHGRRARIRKVDRKSQPALCT